MKVKSLRRLLSRYCTLLTALCLFTLLICLLANELLRTRSNSLIAIGCTTLLGTTLLYLFTSKLNKALIRVYNRRLSDYARDLSRQLKGEQNVDTDVLKDILTEIREQKET